MFRFLESSTLENSNKEKSRQALEKWKRDQSTTNESQSHGDHWKKQHDSLQKTSASSASVLTTGDMPPDIISTFTLPIWIREKKCPMYTSSDPEYKDYVRIQSDPKKVDQLKRQVGQWASARLKNPAHEVNLKYIGFTGKIGVALDLVPQIVPPPLYEVPAIIIFKDGIGLGWKVLRPDLGSQMEAVFRPGVTYAAAKASLNVFFLTSYAIAKAKLTGDQHVVVKLSSAKPSNSVMSAKDIERDNTIPPISKLPPGMNTATIQELMKVLHNVSNTRERHNDLIKQLPLSTAVQVAAATFKQKQLVGIAHAQQTRTRGVLQIRGTIACFGERGKYQMDVVAFFLPSEDKFLGPLVVSNAYLVKDYSRWQQLEEQKKKKKLESQRQDSDPKAREHVSVDKPQTRRETGEGTK